MRLTKHGHSCVRLERGGRVLAIDPGTLTETGPALAGAEAILVTHGHPDHIDADAVLPVLARTAGLHLHAPAAVAAELARHPAAAGAGNRIHAVEPGAHAHVAGFDVRAFGGQHALIHPGIPVVPNLGYLVDGVYHPGDSFTVPHGAAVDTLLVPLHAPWSKTAEVIDFVVAVRAPHAHPIHDGLLNERGLPVVEQHVERFAGLHGTRYRRLAVGESAEAGAR